MTTQHQDKKNQQASKVLKELARRVSSGELDVDWTHLRQGVGGGEWIFRCSLKETDKYGKSKQLSEVSE